MKLSQGKIIEDRLECPYHGWTFNRCGAGESPGSPKQHTVADHYEVREHLGAIWVKSAEAAAPFPEFPRPGPGGYFRVGTLHHEVKAPLEIALDNFCEVEHTATIHASFGFTLARMSEVQVQVETTEQTVRVACSGPTQRVTWPYRMFLGIRPSFHFYDEWTTFFSPVYSVYDHWWADPATGQQCAFRWKVYVFFTPRDKSSTALTSFVFATSQYPSLLSNNALVRRIFLREADYEIRQDIRIIEALADQSADLVGMKLSRFDKALALNRQRIDQIYRGHESECQSAAGAVTLNGKMGCTRH
jgi:phenylpropionate dioxygenase-like ring-hydroxylating dioxygenase large terminal subunit